jgi:hypothetical protein
MHYLARFCRVFVLIALLARPVYAVTPAVFGSIPQIITISGEIFLLTHGMTNS